MTVAVAALCEALAAKGAGKGAEAFVRSDVVLHVAELCEFLATRNALEDLIFATCLSIQILHFSEAFGFLDCLLLDQAWILLLLCLFAL